MDHIKLKQTVLFVVVLVVANSLLFGQEITDKPIFKVHKSSEKMTIDGKMDEKSWKKSEVSNFDFIYLAEKPSDQQKTTYRMLWDDENIYLFFEFEDKYLTARETERDGVPFFDDCAEIFIITSPVSLNPHICFEVNINKAINDIVYVNDFYPGEGLAFKAYNPTINVEAQIMGTVNNNSDIDKGWSIEFAIPKEAFKGADKYHPIQVGTQWSFLALRQDRNEIEGQRRVISTLFPVDNVKEKDVHQPKMFGLMEFVD